MAKRQYTDARRKKDRRYQLSEKAKERNRIRVRKYHANPANAERIKARSLLKNAIESGKIPRAKTLQCVSCDKLADGYHHHRGYALEFALDVVPMCDRCHNKAEAVPSAIAAGLEKILAPCLPQKTLAR